MITATLPYCVSSFLGQRISSQGYDDSKPPHRNWNIEEYESGLTLLNEIYIYLPLKLEQV